MFRSSERALWSERGVRGGSKISHGEEPRHDLPRFAEAAFVERRGVVRLLGAHVDRAHTAAAADLPHETRGWVDRSRAADRHEHVATVEGVGDEVELQRDLAEPHDVRPQPPSAAAPRDRGGRAVRALVDEVRGVAPLASTAQELSVHVVHVPRACALVQRIDVLGAEKESIPQSGFQLREGEVRGIRRAATRLCAPLGIEAPDDLGVAGPSFGRRDVLDPVLLPEPVGVAKGPDAALGADPGTCEDEDALIGSHHQGSEAIVSRDVDHRGRTPTR